MSQRAKISKKTSEPAGKVGSKGHDHVSSIGNSSASEDYSKFSVSEIINAILTRNKDPIIEQMMFALISKLPQEMSEHIQTEKRERSIIIEWLPEPADELTPSVKQRDLEEKACYLHTAIAGEDAKFGTKQFFLGRARLPFVTDDMSIKVASLVLLLCVAAASAKPHHDGVENRPPPSELVGKLTRDKLNIPEEKRFICYVRPEVCSPQQRNPLIYD